MKKLIITDIEIIQTQPPIPYISFTEQAFEKWLEKKLLEAEFDLTKPVFSQYFLKKLATVYYQK